MYGVVADRMQMGRAHLQVHLPAYTLLVIGLAALQCTHLLWAAAFNRSTSMQQQLAWICPPNTFVHR